MSKKSSNPLAKIEDNEEIFVLRGRDISAPRIVCLWIADNIVNDSCSDSKLQEALVVALKMRRQSFRRAAD
jgi:hypothetical protein